MTPRASRLFWGLFMAGSMTVLAAVRGPGAPVQAAGPYLGQTPPGSEPEIFAPNLVSTGMFTRDIAMTPEGDEIYWTVTIGSYAYTTILCSKRVNGRWTAPEVPPFASDSRYRFIEPCISPDGRRFFFVSDRPSPAGANKKNFDVWVMEREGGGWGEPKNLGAPVDSDADEYFPSVARDGTLYFTREAADGSNAIFSAPFVDGRYAQPARLPKEVNCGKDRFNAFVAPDGSYLIVCALGREDSFGGVDYYAVFRRPDGAWTGPVNLGPKVNSKGSGEYSPFVSRDGKYFFFMSSRTDKGLLAQGGSFTWNRLREMHDQPGNGSAAIWWMDASFLEDLRRKAEAGPAEPPAR